MIKRIKNSKGFTLIELVMVIVILAILAAVAVPRFIDLQGDARVSTAKGVAGAIAGAANILHAQYILNNTTYMLGTTQGIIEDTAVLFNANISGATVASNAGGLLIGGGSALITITIGNQPFTMTYTADATTLGPRFLYNF